MSGQPIAEFGDRTLAEIQIVLSGTAKRIEVRSRIRRAELHALAALIRIGHHAPKRFPTQKEFLGEKRRGSSNAEIKAYFLDRIAKQKAKS
ncbi:hypothetical protein [Mangrovicoccus sp. HB161399]|uniref:hypothetical protein n=1 Tax=Mangrovicoccus sp. HB161399 TaxID=2720392 RepID=UPI0015549103|nr:hypothetical protein [Mangrovicoccus sp. HB161399]